MNVSHNVVIVKDKRNDKYGYLRLRTIRDSVPKDTAFGVKKILYKNFNQNKQYVKAAEPNADEINDKIQEVLLQARGGKTQNFQDKKESFLNYAEKVIKGITVPNTKKGKTVALKKFKEYLSTLGREDIKFSEIDSFFAEGYYNHLLSIMSQSSANEYLTIFKYFIVHAKKRQVYTHTVDPFLEIFLKKSKKSYTVMSDYEVETFLGHKFDNELQDLAQHSFGFLMFASGMRISDFLRLKWNKFIQKDDKYFLKFQYKKSKQLHESRLTLEAVRFLRPFMETYEDISFEFYDKHKAEYEQLKKDIVVAQKKYDSIQPKSYGELFSENIYVNDFNQLNEKIKEEMKEEKRKKLQGAKLKGMLEAVPRMEEDMMHIIGGLIMGLKDKHGEEFVFPKMRDVSKEDMHDKTQNLANNFNYHLGVMQKELGIKTTITNHQARHVFAQRLFVAGANFHFISMALGHSSLTITENYREQLVTEEAKDVSVVFSETFKKKVLPEIPVEDKGYITHKELEAKLGRPVPKYFNDI